MVILVDVDQMMKSALTSIVSGAAGEIAEMVAPGWGWLVESFLGDFAEYCYDNQGLSFGDTLFNFVTIWAGPYGIMDTAAKSRQRAINKAVTDYKNKPLLDLGAEVKRIKRGGNYRRR